MLSFYICNIGVSHKADVYRLRCLDIPLDVEGTNVADITELLTEAIKDYMWERPEILNKETTVLNVLPEETPLQLPIPIEEDSYEFEEYLCT